jgi:hypothetical protein
LEDEDSEEEALDEEASEEPVLAELLELPFEELPSEDPLAVVVVFCAAADEPAVVVELTAAFLLEADRAGS